MIRVNMPWWMRMQNYLFLPDGTIFWTSASLSPLQRFKGVEGCNTSKGYVLPSHGQMIKFQDYRLVLIGAIEDRIFNLTTGLQVATEAPSRPSTPSLDVQDFQGFDGDYQVYSSAGQGDIKIGSVSKMSIISHLSYAKHKKWWWRKWEAEGMRIHPKTGKLTIGINVKTWFFTHRNYIKELKV